jgi:tRNA A37 methylthiotransferase MiaB
MFKESFDSEVMMAQLKANNFEVEHEALDDDAEIVIINTCGLSIMPSRNQLIRFSLCRSKIGGIG